MSSAESDEEYKQADTNNDGTVSWNELYEYIDTKVFKGTELSEYANILGIRIEPQPVFDENGKCDEMQSSAKTFSVLKQQILNTIKAQQNADLNNDNVVSYDEAVKASNNLLNRLYGIVDGRMDNKQGTCGSCYILIAQTALIKKFPDLYSNIVQTYNSTNPPNLDDYMIISGNKNNIKDGDVIIKFHGIQAKNGQKCAIIIPRARIIEQQRENNLRLNSFRLGLLDKTPQFGSSDPDAVAMELAVYELAPILGYEDIGLEDFLDMGGSSSEVVYWLTGAEDKSITEKSEIKQALNEFSKESKLIYFANFKDYFKSAYGIF